ncbi:MAG TPA: hypothetical protein P5107_07570 [Thermotogota bacterium]|nr:hypothetical protein [Thermotogota bacterium]HRW34899.1 hypothetical protein [Thermotogota bacterium]
MKKRGLVFFMPLFWLGLLLQNISNFFKESLSDFPYGFFQGLSFVFIVAGFLFICWCLRKKINPFTLKEWESQ